MRRQTGATFREGQIVARAKAIQQEIRPNSWPYSLFVALQEFGPSTAVASAEHWNAMRKTLISALLEHEAKYRYYLDDLPFPAEMALYLATALSDLSEGENHPLFTRKVPRGGRGNIRPRRQSECIEQAVDYLVAVDLGLIDDPRSRSTVAEQFGVTRRQVQRWAAGSGPDKRRRKEFLERWGRQLRNVRDPQRTIARMVSKLMTLAGKEYQELRNVAGAAHVARSSRPATRPRSLRRP